MGMKQDDWQQNKENSTKGVFPENFTQRLWNPGGGDAAPAASFLVSLSSARPQFFPPFTRHPCLSLPTRPPAPDVESLQGLWPYRRSAAAATAATTGQRSIHFQGFCLTVRQAGLWEHCSTLEVPHFTGSSLGGGASAAPRLHHS